MQKIISTTYTATKSDGSEPCYDPIVTVTEKNEVAITVSTSEELNEIDTTNLMEGSTALVTETGTSYVLDDQGNWVETGGGGGSSDFRTITVTFVPIIEGNPTIISTATDFNSNYYYMSSEPNPPEFGFGKLVSGLVCKFPVPNDFSPDNSIHWNYVYFYDDNGNSYVGTYQYVQSIDGDAHINTETETVIIEGDCTITVLARP